jgi:hypothetical protein
MPLRTGMWKWKKWRPADLEFLPPPRRPFRSVPASVPEPFAVYLLGVAAALIALVLTAAMVGDSQVAGVLAPIMGAIGAFTGHAAGHAAALRAMDARRPPSERQRSPAVSGRG